MGVSTPFRFQSTPTCGAKEGEDVYRMRMHGVSIHAHVRGERMILGAETKHPLVSIHAHVRGESAAHRG